MALTTSTITGRVPLPDDANPAAAEIVFTLSGYDTEGDQVIPGGAKARFVLVNGDMPAGAKLWRNTEGLRGTVYAVAVSWSEAARRETIRRTASLGVVQVGDDASYTIAELLDATPVPVPENSYWQSITQLDYDEMMQAKDDAEAAAAAMNVRQVADTTALAALPTTQWKAGLLSSGASYLFDAGNRSAQITAGDPRYVAPASDPTGASGAWALRDRVFANAEDIGVVTGTVSDGVALINAQRINKWLSSADSRIFDWRDDEIGIAETIRLGRDGNGIVGVSGGTMFGAVTAGARAKWQGVAGGTMVLARNNLTTVDLDSPSVYGLTLDGNALAGVGLEFSGVMKPMGDALHVRNLRDNSASYAYQFRHNPYASGGQVNCCYGGRFGSLTCQVAGAANGFLFTGLSGAPGTGVTFCQFGYCHVTCANGYAFVFQKGDDNVFTQIGVSRAAGGTGGQLLFNSQKANALVWVGNVYLNINLSKTDGAAMQIVVSDDATMGNSITYNGVDFMPTLVLSGGSIRSHNKWTFLGQSDYVGGWTNRPHEDLFGPRFPNIDVAAQDVLDHYQERTSDLPGIAFGGTSVGVVYGARSMRSVRIGGVVIVSGSITLSNKGSSTGAATITGLPVNASIGGAISIGYYANLASAFASPPMGLAGGSGVINLYKAGAATAAAMTDADFTDTTRIDFSVSYMVA